MTMTATVEAAGVSDARLIADLPGLITEFRNSRTMRMAAVGITAGLGFIWLPPAVALIPCVTILLHEFLFFPLVVERGVLPLASRSVPKAIAAYRAVTVIGGAAYMTSWAILYTTGEIVPLFIGACWLWGMALFNQIYYARRADLYFLSLAPHLAVAVTLPFFIGLSWWGAALMSGTSLSTVSFFAIGYMQRRELTLHAEADRTARHEAETANRAKSQFLTTMSHELRTPLNAIIGYAELIEETPEGSGEAADDARRIRRAARHLLSPINDVLDLSKIEAGRMEVTLQPADARALLEEIEEAMRPLAAKNRNVMTLEIADTVGEVITDGGRLKQCILNLVSNACKFTENGAITIRAGITNRDSAPMLEIAVIDNGVGISPEAQARLFQPFIQADGSETRRQDGTGLGLVITRRLAQALGGDVDLVSAPGKGSVFTLRVRADAPPAVAVERPAVVAA